MADREYVGFCGLAHLAFQGLSGEVIAGGCSTSSELKWCLHVFRAMFLQQG